MLGGPDIKVSKPLILLVNDAFYQLIFGATLFSTSNTYYFTICFPQVSCLAIVLCRPSSELPVSMKVMLSVGVALLALWTIIGWMLVSILLTSLLHYAIWSLLGV